MHTAHAAIAHQRHAAEEATAGASSWHESSFDLRDGLSVAELSFEDFELATLHSAEVH
jgi:nitrite reductase/ring-hydroxylating ferredoxin subunit